VSVIVDLPRRVMRGGRRLEREQDAALEVLLRPGELVGADVSGGDVGDLGDRDLEALGEVVLSRCRRRRHLPRFGVLRRVAVDGVRHAALLADLLEQSRRGRAADDRVHERAGKRASSVREIPAR
jgi:hypothetical protein